MTTGRSELKRTPLHGWHIANKGQMVDFSGWEMPVQYVTGVVQEHLGTRRFGGQFDVSHMGRFQVSGANTMAFLQKVLTNNAQALQPWEAQYTMIGNEQGGALDDAFLYRFGEDNYLLVVNASNREKNWSHFQEVLSGFEGVILEDLTEALALIAVQGPKSKELLKRVSGKGGWPESRQNCLGRVELCGVDCYLSRTGYTGEPNSFEIFPQASSALKLWEGLLEAGEDPLFIARRMIRCASEDVGMADPNALKAALAAFETWEKIGPPEGELALAQAAVYLSSAPKSNALYLAEKAVKAEIRKTGARPVPLHLRNAPTRLMRQAGYSRGYRYPHDHPNGWVRQDHLPEGLEKREFYTPTNHGIEERILRRMKELRERKR